jgi:hypothetical protein
MLVDVRYASVQLGSSELATSNRLERFLLHHAVPLMDYLCHLMGDLVRVDARTCWREAALAIGVTVEFASEAIGFVTMTSAAPGFELSIRVAGEGRSSIEIHQGRRLRLQSPAQRDLLSEEQREWLATQQIEPGLSDVCSGMPGERELVEAFVRNVLAGEPVQPTLRQHWDVLRVMDAIGKSTKTGQPIRVRTTSFGAHRPGPPAGPEAKPPSKPSGEGGGGGKPPREEPRDSAGKGPAAKNAGGQRRGRKNQDSLPLPPRTGRPAQTSMSTPSPDADV